MELTGMWGSFYRVSVFISKLAYGNALWLGFTVLGLGLFGVAPATVALFAVTRGWVNGQWEEVPVFKTFWQTYKQEFWRANGAALALFLVGFLLYWNFTLFAGPGLAMMVVRGLLLIVSVLYGSMLLLYFPTYVGFDLKGLNRVRAALLIGCGHPLHLILLGASLYGLQFLFMSMPGLILFFGAASVAYLISWVAERIFRSMKRLQLSQQKASSEKKPEGVSNGKSRDLRPEQQGA
ncbi:YesL family protein [Shouchella clausii]|uniref:YesL family protein n=1 Tax=Shouchella clausii TaxID=79880 RepID=UPI0026F4928D|nr:YesL family protein [Shouchella clausii]MDO7269252.1 YesL family protein [Shouchella clausii]MDO7289134.1 YesL family protein [Shouchella clausii]